jgi:hypothetical protein
MVFQFGIDLKSVGIWLGGKLRENRCPFMTQQMGNLVDAKSIAKYKAIFLKDH